MTQTYKSQETEHHSFLKPLCVLSVQALELGTGFQPLKFAFPGFCWFISPALTLFKHFSILGCQFVQQEKNCIWEETCTPVFHGNGRVMRMQSIKQQCEQLLLLIAAVLKAGLHSTQEDQIMNHSPFSQSLPGYSHHLLMNS